MKQTFSNANSAADKDMESRIRIEETRMLYSSMSFSMLATVVVSLIMYVIMYRHAVSVISLTIWFVVMVVSMLMRSWDTYRFLKTSSEDQKNEIWVSRFLVGTVFAGFWWGLLLWMGYSEENEYQTLIVVCVIGIVSGSLSTLSYRWSTIVSFLLPALLLLEFRLIYDEGDFSNILSYLLAVFIVFALLTSRRIYKNLNQNIRLQIEAGYREQSLREAKNDAEKANVAKSKFLSNMSHELRTPLHAVLGYAQLLEHDDKLSEKQSNNVREIDNAGKLLLDLVNQILDLARLEEGGLKITMSLIPLEELMKECKSLVQPFADEKNIQIQIPETNIYVHADYTRLKQAILNLLTNGIKYNHDYGSVTISCKLLDGNRVKIAVADSGTGIPIDMQQHLFQPFNRLGQESDTDGTGIGLSIARQLIEMMNGEICVESDIGEGSIFSIELDGEILVNGIEQTDENNLVSKSPSKPSQKKRNGRILVIEDNAPNLKLILYQIDMLGYVADFATDGDEALYMFRKNKYGLVITDCNMPNMSGYEFSQSIRNKENSNVPVIALTADAFPESEEKCLAAGMNARLVKPVDIEDLKAAIEKWLIDVE